MTALDNIKAALDAGPRSRVALEVWRATQPYQGATEKQERAFLAGYKEGRDAAIRELLAYVESLEKDAGRYRSQFSVRGPRGSWTAGLKIEEGMQSDAPGTV